MKGEGRVIYMDVHECHLTNFLTVDSRGQSHAMQRSNFIQEDSS